MKDSVKEIRDEIVPVAKLIPYAKNTVTHSDFQVNNIISLIKSFGFTNPILIDEENVIIAGHGRLKAAQKMGLENVPCRRFVGYSRSEAKAYRLLDNRITEQGREWDSEMLQLELDDIDFSGLDLSKYNLDFESLLTGDNDEDNGDDKDDDVESPEDFTEYDEDIDTEHECPKCGYKWSGGG